MRTPSTEEIRTDRLVLSPLRLVDASDMVGTLADPDLYEFMGGEAPSLDQLEALYRAQISGPNDGLEVWHNWIVRVAETGCAAGFVQATVRDDHADVAWVIGVEHQRLGFATEAARAICNWLEGCGVGAFSAHIHPQHIASSGVASNIGLIASGEIDADGELIWVKR